MINVQGGDSTSAVPDHSHSNLDTLESISTDTEGYEWLTRQVEVKDPETGEISTQTVTEKVKAGYADKAKNADVAFDLAENSPAARRFLSRIADDRSTGKIASDKGFEAGEYVAGVSGGMLGVDGVTGDSFAEVDRLMVRVKAFFEELTVVKAGVLAGKQYITPGGGVVCVAVEETDTAYRCYFLSEQDGEKTETRIVAGDQAISEMFNARTGTANKVSNHRYWRLVTAVDNDAYTDASGNHYGYIDLSKTDCEADSSIPQARDEICQLGNRTDPTRQAAMVFSTVDADAPSVKLFGGINSYSLAGKAIISFGREPSGGKVYFRLGASGASQYLEYNQDGGLELAGRLSVLSTVGDKTLGCKK